jgi:nucleoside-diphosphate-sugar epimerase
MNICILGGGTIGKSLAQSLSDNSNQVYLGSAREKRQIDSFPDQVHSYNYGQISDSQSGIDFEKCIITTRIDLLSDKQRARIYSDIKSLALKDCEFVNLSSVAVYGSSIFPRDENADLKPVNEYGEMKVKVEIVLNEIIPNKKLLNLRIANLYGNRGFNDLTNKVLNNVNATEEIIVSDIHNLRDFVYYQDLKNFLEHWIYNKISCQGNMNFASGVSCTIENWLEQISQITKLKYFYKKGFPEQLAYSVIDIRMLENVWNRPLTNSKIGLHEYVGQVQENL